MAVSGRAIRAGAAAVEILADDSNFTPGLRRATRNMEKFGRAVRNIGMGMAAVGGAMTAAVGGIVSETMRAQANFTRFSLVMGENTRMMTQRLQSLSDQTGVAMTTLIEMSATFGAIFAGMRKYIGEEGYSGIVEKATKLTLDLAASMGLSFTDAAERVKSMLTSTGEAVDQFGINVRQAEINLALQELGIKKNLRQLTEYEKQIVKLNIMERQLVENRLTIIEMSDTLSTQYALLTSQMKHLRAEGGQYVADVLKPILKWVNDIMRTGFVETVTKVGVTAGGIVGPALGGIGGVLAQIGFAGMGLSEIPKIMKKLNAAIKINTYRQAAAIFAGWLVQVPLLKSAIVGLTTAWHGLTAAITASTVALRTLIAATAVFAFAQLAIGAYTAYQEAKPMMDEFKMKAARGEVKLHRESHWFWGKRWVPVVKKDMAAIAREAEAAKREAAERGPSAGAITSATISRQLAFGPAGMSTAEAIRGVDERISSVIDDDAVRVKEKE